MAVYQMRPLKVREPTSHQIRSNTKEKRLVCVDMRQESVLWMNNRIKHWGRAATFGNLQFRSVGYFLWLRADSCQ